jgi:cytochrome c553
MRVVALEFRIAGIGSNGNGGPGGGALISTPVAIGNGAWDPKRILGDATVREDGSVFVEVPARTPVYFQLLDERGRMVQTMRSWSTLQPGENASCVGCHEHKNSGPVAGLPLAQALRQRAETLHPFYGSPRGFSFPQEIQPILDRHCVRCHDGRADVPYALTAHGVQDTHAKRRWSRSYLALTHAREDKPTEGLWRGDADHAMVNWVSAQSAPPVQPPYAAGANRSRLIELLEGGHEEVRLSREELGKLSAWIDLGVPYCGDYVEANTWTDEERAKHERYSAKRRRLEEEDRRNIAAWIRQSNGSQE